MKNRLVVSETNYWPVISVTTHLLHWIWFGFSRLRRVVARLTGRPWCHWDGEAWQKVGPRLFGRRTVLALDGEGHKLHVRIAQWVDLTSLVGRPEEEGVERLVKNLPAGGTFVDAGAHIGRYSLLAADRIGPSGRVISIEPSPDNFALLCQNAAQNGMNWIIPIQVALGKEDGTAELTSGSDQAVNSLHADWLDCLEGTGSVEQRTRQAVVVRSLPSLLTEVGVGQVDLLKIDVEGAELDVLKGAVPLLRSGQVQQIVCEVHEPVVRLIDIETLLRNCGFTVKGQENGELHAVRNLSRIGTNHRPLRLAIVGCGAITQMAHIPAASRLDEVRLIGLVDTDLAQAQALAARCGVPMAAASLDGLIGEIDAVVLATPPHVRAGLAQRALEYGLHVLCEKPMANSGWECLQMIEKARAAQRTLAVAHTYRFLPNRVYVCALYQSGRLGRLVSARIEQGEPYSWPTRTGYTLRKECVPGGVLFNEGVHILDMLLSWFGVPQEFDYYDDSLGGLESNVRLVLHYSHGAEVYFRLSRTCLLSNRIEMEFEKASLAFPLYNMADLELAPKGGQFARVVLCQKRFDFVELAEAQLRTFAEALKQGSPSIVPAEAGLAVVDLIEACYRSKTRHPRPQQSPLPGITW